MFFWKRMMAGFVGGIVAGLLTASVWAEPSEDIQRLISAHRQAAVEAQQKVTFHEEMERNFKTGRGGSKIDMVGHCQYWAGYYHKLAEKEEAAARQLEQKRL